MPAFLPCLKYFSAFNSAYLFILLLYSLMEEAVLCNTYPGIVDLFIPRGANNDSCTSASSHLTCLRLKSLVCLSLPHSPKRSHLFPKKFLNLKSYIFISSAKSTCNKFFFNFSSIDSSASRLKIQSYFASAFALFFVFPKPSHLPSYNFAPVCRTISWVPSVLPLS